MSDVPGLRLPTTREYIERVRVGVLAEPDMKLNVWYKVDLNLGTDEMTVTEIGPSTRP